MKIPVRRSCLSLIVLSALVEVIRANENENSTEDVRRGRVSGRIIKLYSGYKPDPVLCTEEGFKADPVHCSVFYRCLKSSSGKFTVFKFQCGPGTVYDPETEVCNHASSTKRSECGGIKSHVELDTENENDIEQNELPSPISTILPVYTSHTNNVTYKDSVTPNLGSSGVFITSTENGYINLLTTSSAPYQVGTTIKDIQDINHNLVTNPWIDYYNATQQKTTSSATMFQILEKRQSCTSEGFMGDSENCKKFYRCVNNLRGGFIRYEFLCSEPTVWDDRMQSCNHPWAVRNGRCGRGGINNKNHTEVFYIKQDVPPEQTGLNSGATHPEASNQDRGDVSKIKKFPAYYGDRISNLNENRIEEKPINYGSYSDQPTKTNEHKNEVTEENIHIDIDEIYNNYQFGQKIEANDVTNKYTENNVPQFTEIERTLICTHSGFIGDPNDCNKFYRCVGNGKGGFKRYEFACSQGTVWDKKLEACNYAWAVKECGGTSPVDSLIAAESPTSSSTSSTVSSESVDNGYTNQANQEHDRPTTITVSTPISLISTTAASKFTDRDCTVTGFIGDKNDCKKFYRCVDNGRGTFTKYEYKCGDGTLWDQNIEACNHAWAVNSCNLVLSNTIINTTSVTSAPITTSPAFFIKPTTPDQLLDNNEAYKPQDAISLEPEINLHTTLAPVKTQKNDCESTGFKGDINDCTKFYRCVNNGQQGFTKYEFSCGEGTVWDPEIEACNHDWAVTHCGTSTPSKDKILSSSTANTYLPTNNHDLILTTPISSIKTSTPPSKEINEYDLGYNQQHSELTKQPDIDTETTTLKQIYSQPNHCQASGFIGDVNNCNKFYRCVNNGNGGFIRHEFYCGEGTLWDPEIEACNHAWAVKHCGGGIPSKENTLTSSTTSNSNNVESNNEYVTQNYTDSETTTPFNNYQVTSIVDTNEKNECKSNGFMGDISDCKKFYRCVDNGNGVYTRYVFSCGDGTLWDPQINACNHASAVKGCESFKNPNNDISVKPTSNPSSDKVIDQTTSTQRSSNNYAETTISFAASHSTATPVTVTITRNECESNGFMSDDKDCQKFYRCVDNGNGGFIKHEFMCGSGTVWDSNIQACNHKWAVEKCGSDSNSEFIKTTTNSVSPMSPAIESEATTFFVTSTTSATTSTTISTSSGNLLPSHDDGECSSEGIFANSNDCTKFYRCVSDDKDGYTKYDFSCAEGTAWDVKTQSCNHLNKVEACQNSLNTPVINPIHDEHTDIESVTTKTTTLASTSTENLKLNVCEAEGYFGDKNDCKKFYRCVNENDSRYTKYDFVCGDGTIWDQDITACNHPYDVKTPSCRSEPENISPVSTIATSTVNNETPSPIYTEKPASTTSEGDTNKNETNLNCNNNTSGNNDDNNKNVTCTKAGFYADPNNCKKFYRCVDWENNGNKFSIYHFDCADGTIWDPALETCNHEDSVYPPRNCNGKPQQNENTAATSSATEETTTTTYQSESTTTSSKPTKTTTKSTTSTQYTSTQTMQSPTTHSSSTKAPTTQSSTTKKPTTQSSTTKQSTTQSSTTEESTTQSSTTEESTTQSTTTEESTTHSTTTEESTTHSTTTEESTTQSTTTKEPTTEETTTRQTTVGTSTTNEQSTQQGSTTSETDQEQTTKSSTTQTTNEATTTVEPGTTTTQMTTSAVDQTSATTEPSTSTVETSSPSTTESNQESSTESSTNQECPDTTDDQYLYVCPTSFKRHPKYCNLFYQCTEDNDNHELKIAVFNCPNNTIYDENKIQCVEKDKSSKKCTGQISQKYRVKRLGAAQNDPFIVTRKSMACRNSGHFPFETHTECSSSLLKCELTKSGKLQGFVYRCPEGFVYWNISRRCERIAKVRDCKRSSYPWKSRYDIPLERFNIAP